MPETLTPTQVSQVSERRLRNTNALLNACATEEEAKSILEDSWDITECLYGISAPKDSWTGVFTMATIRPPWGRDMVSNFADTPPLERKLVCTVIKHIRRIVDKSRKLGDPPVAWVEQPKVLFTPLEGFTWQEEVIAFLQGLGVSDSLTKDLLQRLKTGDVNPSSGIFQIVQFYTLLYPHQRQIVLKEYGVSPQSGDYERLMTSPDKQTMTPEQRIVMMEKLGKLSGIDPDHLQNALEQLKTAQENQKKPKFAKALKKIKKSSADASWRTASRQTMKTCTTLCQTMVDRMPLDPATAAFIKIALGTEWGHALVAQVISLVLETLPGKYGEKAERLAEELRTESFTLAMDQIGDSALGPLRQMLFTTLEQLPDVEPACLPEGQEVTSPLEQIFADAKK